MQQQTNSSNSIADVLNIFQFGKQLLSTLNNVATCPLKSPAQLLL